MRLNFIKRTIIAIIILPIISCSKETKKEDVILIHQKLDLENQMLNYESTLKIDGGHSSTNYSSIDSVSKYSVGYKFVLPDSVRSKDLKLYVSAWVRESIAPLDGSLAVALSNSKGILLWNTSNYKGSSYTPNTWVNIKDSIFIGRDLLLKDSYNEIRIFGTKDRGSDALNIDDIEFTCKY
jgi:hypothetical protein